MKLKALAATVSAVVSVPVIAQTTSSPTGNIRSISFVGMPAPATDAEKTDIYSKAQIKITDRAGDTETYDLVYHELMGTTDSINGKLVGGLYDAQNAPITDANGQLASDAPDGTSLLRVRGLRSNKPKRNNALALVTNYEYKELAPEGQTGSFWSKLPATMSLALLDQNKNTGKLSVVDYNPIRFSEVYGLWTPCAASRSPWNTHLAGEEYEPDAKVREGLARASDSDDATDIASFSKYYFGDPATANAYHYGLTPEVKVLPDGTAVVQKHYALGRVARELVDVMPDHRTAYMGDDGKATGLFMFIADKAKDLSAGALYAGKWNQTGAGDGGQAAITWVKLGSSSDAEIRALVDGGIRFSDIFDVSLTDPGDPRYTKVVAYTGTEWLKLKPGREKAAAFLETRRYAALLDATTEFTKMEGVTHDAASRRAYVVISRIEKTMADTTGDIQLAENQGGGVYELDLARRQNDSEGNPIASRFVARTMKSIPELLGGWLGRDADGKEIRDTEGNRCRQDKVCGPDNIKFSPAARTLFIGEDTARRNNNYVWTFNLDTRQLSRILSVPRAAEATGLEVVENLNGHAYIISNFQHPGEAEQMTNPGDAALLPLLESKWNGLQRAPIGYIGIADGALPPLK